MENGGELQLVLIGNDVHLIARDSQWELNAGEEIRELPYSSTERGSPARPRPSAQGP